jgi:uncharacterized protein YbjT (DUF2867 family)
VNRTVNRVLVIGATGSIGRHVVAGGLRCGYVIRALVRRSGQIHDLPLEVESIVGDLTDATSLREAVADIDGIIFTHGSNGRPPGPEDVDYGAVRNVLRALKGRRARIALVSTRIGHFGGFGSFA